MRCWAQVRRQLQEGRPSLVRGPIETRKDTQEVKLLSAACRAVFVCLRLAVLGFTHHLLRSCA